LSNLTVYVPAGARAWLKVFAGWSGAPLVTVWLLLLLFVHVTLAPRATVICAGSNANAEVMSTLAAAALAGADGLAEHATSKPARMAVARPRAVGTPRQATPSPARI
jgi:hypothetical protein